MVVAPYDDFGFGPIAGDSVETRSRWVEDELGITGWQDVCQNSLPVLKASIDADMPPIAWISPDSASSVAGFLWWLSHMDHREILVQEVPRLGLLNPQSLIEHFDREVPLTVADRNIHRALWQKLQSENAPLRVLTDDRLLSASIDYFDAALIKRVTPEWRKMARILGDTLHDFHETGVFQAGDIILSARLCYLAETGSLEWQGDLSDIRNCHLRLPK